jgi:hypothetical protein
MSFDRQQLEHFADGLGLGFYLLMVLAFFTAVTSSAGLAFALLVLGAAAHILRLSLEGLVSELADDARFELRVPEAISQLRLPRGPWRTPPARRRR